MKHHYTLTAKTAEREINWETNHPQTAYRWFAEASSSGRTIDDRTRIVSVKLERDGALVKSAIIGQGIYPRRYPQRPVMDIIDRIAWRLAEGDHDPHMPAYRERARRLLAEIREPTEPMCDAGSRGPMTAPDQVWRRMIDAAMK